MFHRLYIEIIIISNDIIELIERENITSTPLLKYGPLDFCTYEYSGITCEDTQGLSDGKKASKGHHKINFHPKILKISSNRCHSAMFTVLWVMEKFKLVS